MASGRIEAACPECGARMVRAISGVRCPRFGACGRGGAEETVARLRKPARLALEDARDRRALETA